MNKIATLKRIPTKEEFMRYLYRLPSSENLILIQTVLTCQNIRWIAICFMRRIAAMTLEDIHSMKF